MAIIGQSKNTDLLQRVITEGTKYRDLTYKDTGDTEPLVVTKLPGVLSTGDSTGPTADIQREVRARIDDTKRITKLLTTYQGIKWQGHNAALTAIQDQLDRKRGKYAGDSNQGGILGTLLNVGRGLLKTLDWDAVTLAQTAVAGTGEHFSAWQSRSYIKAVNSFGGVLADLLGQVGIGTGTSPAQTVLNGGKVLIDSDSIEGRQLPDGKYSDAPLDKPLGVDPSSWNTIAYARLPKDQNGNFTMNPKQYRSGSTYEYGAEKPYTINSEESLEQQYRLSKRYEASGSEAQKPGYGHDPKVKDALTVGPNAAGYGINTSMSFNSNEYATRDDQGDESSTYLDRVRGDKLESSRIVGINPGARYEGTIGERDSDIGPWKPEGAHALLAAQTPNESKGTSDKGYNNDGGSTILDANRMAEGAQTRVDNGRIDLIPFWIRAICPGTSDLYGGTPSGANGYLFFEANLDSYSDNYEASWEGTQYVGRADKFWNYSGFDRSISFSFKMVAHSKAHLKPIYNRLNGLLSMTAPTYGNNEHGGSFMRGTLAEITIGDLLSKQLGFIKSVGLKWETDYMWETDKSTILVPHVLGVSINFTPIHRFVPHTDLRYFQLVNDNVPGVPTFTVNHKVLYSTTGSLAR